MDAEMYLPREVIEIPPQEWECCTCARQDFPIACRCLCHEEKIEFDDEDFYHDTETNDFD